MPLFNDLAGFSNTCFADMFEIVRCDGGLGSSLVPGDNTVTRFTYAPTQNGISNLRIGAIVNVASNIVLAAVGPGFVTPDGVVITAVAGYTMFPDAAGVIRVFYDVGTSYFVLDAAGGQISFPRQVCLYHEMAHAFHMASGTLNSADPEFQAQTDENGFRGQVGIALRDPTNHSGGIGAGNAQVVPSCSGTTGTATSGGCFIVSAAAGSSNAPQVEKLKRARDAFITSSPLFGALAMSTLEEYYRFSPSIAADMAADPALKAAIGDWFVAPLTRFEEIVAAVTARSDAAGLLAAIGSVADNPATLCAVAAAALRMADRLKAGGPGRVAAPPAEPGVDGVFAYVGDRILASGSAPGIAWMAGALALYWRAATGEIDTLALHSAIDDWLASAPIPMEIFDMTPTERDADFVRLGATVLRAPDVRRHLAGRVLAAARAAGRPTAELGETLMRLGYLDANKEV